MFLQLLFLADCRFNGLQLGAAALQVRIGRYKGCVQFLRGKAVLLHSGNGSRHLFEVVDSRPTVIADAFSLGSFCGTVNHFLNGTCRGDFLRFSSPCAVCFCGVVFGYGDSLFGGSVGVLLQNGEICEKKELQKQVLAYAKTRDVRDGLKKQKSDKARRAYREKHESDFIIADAATRYFKQKGVTKLPTYKALQAEIEQLTAEKNALYNEYRANKERVRELQTMKSNLSQMHHGEPSRQKKHEQER